MESGTAPPSAHSSPKRKRARCKPAKHLTELVSRRTPAVARIYQKEERTTPWATTAQVIANRANAQLSTGPRTAEGQQASSSNAKSHGLTSRSAFVPGEDPQEYELFHHAYTALYLPQDMIEQKMVSELADLEDGASAVCPNLKHSCSTWNTASSPPMWICAP